jgi:hypothetical protein
VWKVIFRRRNFRIIDEKSIIRRKKFLYITKSLLRVERMLDPAPEVSGCGSVQARKCQVKRW